MGSRYDGFWESVSDLLWGLISRAVKYPYPHPPTHNYDELKNVFLKPADKHYTRRLMRTHILSRPLTIMQKRCFSL